MAFKTAEHADGDERNLVSRLRKSDCYSHRTKRRLVTRVKVHIIYAKEFY